MPIKSRPRLFVASALFAVAASAEAPVLRSTTFSWEEIQAKPAPNGRSRSLFRSATATLDELEIHVTTLPPGQASHAPHTHPEEEVIIIKEGLVEVFQAGETRRVGPGGWAPAPCSSWPRRSLTPSRTSATPRPPTTSCSGSRRE